MRRVVLVAIASFVLLAGYAWAAETTPADIEADEMVRRALDLRRQGNNAGAVDLLRRAEDLAPSGRILAQLGFAEFALQHWVDAETDSSELWPALIRPGWRTRRTGRCSTRPSTRLAATSGGWMCPERPAQRSL